jgi:hypothetical protein
VKAWFLILCAAVAVLLTVLLGAAIWLFIPSWPLRLIVWSVLTAPAGGTLLLCVALDARGSTTLL